MLSTSWCLGCTHLGTFQSPSKSVYGIITIQSPCIYEVATTIESCMRSHPLGSLHARSGDNPSWVAIQRCCPSSYPRPRVRPRPRSQNPRPRRLTVPYSTFIPPNPLSRPLSPFRWAKTMEPRSEAQTKPRTRRRRALACHACRHKKLRCDRQQPCSNCTRSKDRNNVCTYADGAPAPAVSNGGEGDEGAPRGKRRRGAGTDSAEASIPTGSVEDTAEVSSATPDHSDVPLSIRQQRVPSQKWHSSLFASVLVDPLLSATVPGEGAAAISSSSATRSAGSDVVLRADRSIGQIMGGLEDPIRALMVRTRYIAPSSWLYSILLVSPGLVSLLN